jgi:hypothetical protein
VAWERIQDWLDSWSVILLLVAVGLFGVFFEAYLWILFAYSLPPVVFVPAVPATVLLLVACYYAISDLRQRRESITTEAQLETSEASSAGEAPPSLIRAEPLKREPEAAVWVRAMRTLRQALSATSSFIVRNPPCSLIIIGLLVGALSLFTIETPSKLDVDITAVMRTATLALICLGMFLQAVWLALNNWPF